MDCPYHLDIGGLRDTPESFFGVSSSHELMSNLYHEEPLQLTDFIHRGPTNPENAIKDLSRDLTVTVIPTLGSVNSALTLGEELHKNFHKNEGVEYTVCKVAKVAVEQGFSTMGTGVIVGGIPLLVTESIAFPPLALTIPVVGAALPEAYANMQEFSKFAGEKAEKDCHLLFRNY